MCQEKHSFWSLIKKYDKIEIPIIQRDYAQGREDVEKIRNNFVNYLVTNLVSHRPIELDFVYGTDDNGLFIPLDGQQRLTTLFLLYWYIALKENRLEDNVRRLLCRFTYETRPSSHDFIGYLCNNPIPQDKPLKDYIANKASWYDDQWNLDPTVSGMLIMIDALEGNQLLNSNLGHLFDDLTNETMPISFFFISLKDFGLTENLYIRMNARGKVLTGFENFKSEFYKIIENYTDVNGVKDKMEYQWVSNLWSYREFQDTEKEIFVTDTYFMNYLQFISKMLYYHFSPNENEKADVDFLDNDVLKTIYSVNGNVDFLSFALDNIPTLREYSGINLLWDNDEKTLPDILIKCVTKGDLSINETFILYDALRYLYKVHSMDNIDDYLRVVRNLIVNTNDKSQREWSKIIPSTLNLIQSENVYQLLAQEEIALEGLSVPQRDEEIFKARLIAFNPGSKPFVHKAEDHNLLQGNISSLFISLCSKDEEKMYQIKIKNVNYKDIDIEKFKLLFEAYEKVSFNDFDIVWGDLLDSSLYIESEWRCTYNMEIEYCKHPAVIMLAKSFSQSAIVTLEEFLINQERNYVLKVSKGTLALEQINNAKEQLALLYIITCRLMKKNRKDFFKDGCNFGWLSGITGYSTPFVNGLKNCRNVSRPIYQTYVSSFQYNKGILTKRTPEVLIANNGRPQKVMEKLLLWASE